MLLLEKSDTLPLMIRHAFKMKLKPGCEVEYKRRHDALWPELSQALSEAGVSDYSIFLDEETRTLFAVQKLADDHHSDELPMHPVVRKWWKYNAELMEVHADDSPLCWTLPEVFHLS